jgi:hypothetical protein
MPTGGEDAVAGDLDAVRCRAGLAGSHGGPTTSRHRVLRAARRSWTRFPDDAPVYDEPADLDRRTCVWKSMLSVKNA